MKIKVWYIIVEYFEEGRLIKRGFTFSSEKRGQLLIKEIEDFCKRNLQTEKVIINLTDIT